MLSDEEKKAVEKLDYIQDFIIENGQYNADVNDMEYFSKVLNLIKKQSKEIEELKFKYQARKDRMQKEIEELNKSDASKEQSSMNYYNLYKELVDKIKAKIEEQEKIINTGGIDYNTKSYARCKKEFGQSLLEKE